MHSVTNCWLRHSGPPLFCSIAPACGLVGRVSSATPVDSTKSPAEIHRQVRMLTASASRPPTAGEMISPAG